MKRRVFAVAVTVVGMIVLLAITLAAFRLNVLGSMQLIGQGAFGSAFGASRTVVKTTPLLLTGLGMVIAWRAGMYNIGGEGQFVLGGLCGSIVAKAAMDGHWPVPGVVGQLLILIACGLGGAAWAWLAGWLYVKRGVEVVISTILLNFVAVQILGYAVNGPLQESKHQLPLTDTLPPALMLPKFSRQLDLNAGALIALVAAIVVFVYLARTVGGYRLRLAGENPFVARANRINAPRTQVTAMLLSGGLCGLAGGVEYLGIAGRLGGGFAQGWGFLGIPVALLAGLNPLTAIVTATYFGALLAGTQNLAGFTSSGTTLVYVIQGAAVLGFVALKTWIDRRPVAVEAD